MGVKRQQKFVFPIRIIINQRIGTELALYILLESAVQILPGEFLKSIYNSDEKSDFTFDSCTGLFLFLRR